MSIEFKIAQGGLGRRLPGEDYISGLVFVIADANLPGGFSDTDRIKKVNSLAEAEGLGISAAATSDDGKILHYHVKEFFRIYEGKTQSIGELWINLVNTSPPGPGFTAAAITDLQTAASNKIRQFAVYTNVTFAASLVTTAGTALATLATANAPAVAVVTGDFVGTLVSAFPDIRGLASPYVSVDCSQDGGSVPEGLATAKGASVSGIGTVLGSIAAASVHENIGWVAPFNIANDVDYQIIKIANGDNFADLTAANITTLINNGYIFARTRQGAEGAYYNDTPQAVLADNDFAFVENSRTIQKVLREVHKQIVPFINAPLVVDASSGKLSETTIFQLESACFQALNGMAADGNIATDQSTGQLPLNSVFIDPDQNVISTSKVVITIRVVPIGTQRQTEINIGFAPKLNTGS